MNGLTICLTGGIASGKTFVSDYLASKGFLIIDADVIAREVVAIGMPALKKIKYRFGGGVLNVDGSLNRSELKRVAFSNKINVADLNAILHPTIGAEIKQQINDSQNLIKFLVIPLYKESMLEMYQIDRVLSLDVAADVQLQRVVTRDSINLELARKIVSVQSSRTSRLKIADDVIVNNTTFNHLRDQADLLLEMYDGLCKN